MIDQYGKTKSQYSEPEDNEECNKEKHIHITVNTGDTVPLSIYERVNRIAKISFNRINAYEEELKTYKAQAESYEAQLKLKSAESECLCGYLNQFVPISDIEYELNRVRDAELKRKGIKNDKT